MKLIRFPGEDALYMLTTSGMAHFPEARARRVLNIAWEFGNKAEPCDGGYVHVYYHGEPGQPVPKDAQWSVVEHVMSAAERKEFAKARGNRKPLVISSREPYTERNSSELTRGETMPPVKRGRAKPAVQEPEANGSTSKLDNVEKYMTGNITPTLTDYATWFASEVTDPDKLDSERLIAMAVTFYGEFQASDFNKDQKAARKEARETRATANGDDADEPAKPAARGRGSRAAASKPATGKPAGRPGRKPAAARSSGAAVY